MFFLICFDSDFPLVRGAEVGVLITEKSLGQKRMELSALDVTT